MVAKAKLKPIIIFYSRGAVAVSMDIRMLDIDQCEDKYWVPNAFKGTHKCHETSSYVRKDYHSLD